MDTSHCQPLARQSANERQLLTVPMWVEKPYLVWIRGRDDPHTVSIVFILHRVVRGGDDTTRPT